MMSFPFQLSVWQDVFIMAEEFQKYKNILDQEREEFKQQLEREVSAFLSFQVDNGSNI